MAQTKLSFNQIDGAEINVMDFSGATDTDKFNAAIAYVNANGSNGVYTGDGLKIKIPAGTYSLLNGLDSITVDGVHWQGDGPDATFINGQANIIFRFGNGTAFIDSCSVRDLSVVCDSAITPNSNFKVAYLQHGTRLTLDNIKIIRVPSLIYAYADPSETISNIKISNIVGQQYDAGVALIECFKDPVAYSAGAGAGLYLNSIRVNLDGVAAPPEDDGSVAHTASAGAVGLFIRGFWDTVICDEVIFNRHGKGIHFQASTSSFGITNTYFSNTILDYMGTHAIHLQALGGNITKMNFEHGWLNSSDDDTVAIARTGGLLDMITIQDTDYLMGGLHNNDVDSGCTNIRFIGNRFFGCGRKQLTTASPTKTSHGFNIAADCDGLVIKDNTYRDGFSYYGAGSYPLVSGDYDPNTGINLASVAMQMEIRDNKMRGTNQGYSWTAATLFATGNTEYRSFGNNYNDDNTKAEYLGFGTSGIAASPATEVNRTGCPVIYHFRAGTITNITVNGQVVANSTDVSIPVDHSDTIVVTYSSAPTVVRQMMN